MPWMLILVWPPIRSAFGTLARVLDNDDAFIPLIEVRSDDWLRNQGATVRQALLGYAQSWALFRYLMEEQPRKLREYVELIYSRRTPEQRLADFGQAFGGDLAKLDAKYQHYMRKLVRTEHRPAR